MIYQIKNSITCGLCLLLLIGSTGCGGPEPRRPVEVKTGSFYKESIARSKKRLALEEKQIQEIIQRDTLHEYKSTASGSWYYYDVENKESDYMPQPDDLVVMTYNIVGFDNDTIYSQEDIGVLTYKVDKQDLFSGLRNSIKLLKEGETATFLYPSALGYGYHGDDEKIGVNVPLKSTLTILKIEKQTDSIN